MTSKPGRVTMATFSLAVITLAGAGGAKLLTRQKPRAAVEAHIEELEKSLPPDSPMRADLESGARGDGIRQTWMDKMRQQGVKRAWVVTFTGLNDPSKEWKVYEVAYYSAYDREGSQITDPKWLERILASGLANELNQVALDRARLSAWHEHDSRLIPIDLLDDEWLPSVTYEQAQAHIRRVIASLAPDSDLRLDLKIGDRGDGINYAWMDEMRKEGIRRVEIAIDIDFHDDGRPGKMKITAVRYYTKYDPSGSQVQDPKSLERIRTSGLEEELRALALRQGEHGAWADVPRPRPDPFVGGATAVFYDDGWLPAPPYPMFTTARPN